MFEKRETRRETSFCPLWRDSFSPRAIKVRGGTVTATGNRECAVCHKVFFSQHPGKRVCSVECFRRMKTRRGKIHKKRIRENQKYLGNIWNFLLNLGNATPIQAFSGRFHHTEETREKISKALKGENGPWWGKHGEDHPRYIKDRSLLKETELYCQKFTPEFRERVRAFWGYECGNCGKPQSENILKNGTVRKLSIHHIHNNKDACCNDDLPWHFIPLCKSCHGKAGGSEKNREKWEKKLARLIEKKFGGKCYYHKVEVLAGWGVA